MRVRTTSRGLAVAALLVLLPGVARSQTIPSPFRFVETSQEGGLFAGTSSLARGRFGLGPGGGFEFGGRWGIDLSGPLGFEIVSAWITGTRDVINPAKLIGDKKVGEADVLIGTAEGRLRITLTGDRTWHRLSPFILAGGGIAFDLSPAAEADELLLEGDRFEFGTSFIGTMGVGSRLFVTDRLALRGDAVFSLWKLDTPPGFSEPGRGYTAVEKSEWASGRHFTLSAVIRF